MLEKCESLFTVYQPAFRHNTNTLHCNCLWNLMLLRASKFLVSAFSVFFHVPHIFSATTLSPEYSVASSNIAPQLH